MADKAVDTKKDEKDPDTDLDPQKNADDSSTSNDEPVDDDSEKKFSQADLNKILAKKLAKERRDATEREAAAAKRASKEAEEQKLLEDGKLEELAERKQKEADDANSKLADYERRDKVNALLDKKEITNPYFRGLFERMNGELAELSELADGFKEKFDLAVEKGVTTRLGSDPPPKTAKKPKELSLDEQIEAAETKMRETGDPTESMALKARKARGET